MYRREIDLEEMIRGYESGSISEAFGVGTAAAVANITSITHKDQKLEFKLNENGFTGKLKTNLQTYNLDDQRIHLVGG